jgi:hypothetical protein
MLPSGLPDAVEDAEPLARFLTSDKQFNASRVKPSAFMPGPVDDATSVFRQSADDLVALWSIADVELRGDRRARAVAVLRASDVRQASLDVQAHEPPLRHANIVGWPSAVGDRDQTRALRKERALLLSQAALLTLR